MELREILHTSIYIISAIFLVALSIEMLVSFIKKDKIYSLYNSINNVINIPVSIALASLHTLLRDEITADLPFTFFSKVDFSLTSFLFAIVCADFVYFVLHYAMHKFEYLWYFHTIHHNSTKFNLTLNARRSWLEEISHMFLTSTILYAFTPFNLETIIWGQYIVHRYQYFTHSQYIKIPRILGYIFILPQTHMIHHDQNESYQNSNYGPMFSIWDIIFGTYVHSIDESKFVPGVKNVSEDNFFKIHLYPFKKIYSKIAQRKYT